MVNIPKRSISSLETSSSKTLQKKQEFWDFCGSQGRKYSFSMSIMAKNWPAGQTFHPGKSQHQHVVVQQMITEDSELHFLAFRCQSLSTSLLFYFPITLSINHWLGWNIILEMLLSLSSRLSQWLTSSQSETHRSNSAQSWWAIKAETHTWINLMFLWRAMAWSRLQTFWNSV